MNTNEEHNFTKEGKIALLMPMVFSIGRETLADKKAFNKFSTLLDIIKPKISEEDLTEQVFWGVVAVKKYKITFEEAHEIICNKNTIDYCFDKYIAADGLKEFTEPLDLSIIKH